MDSSGSVDTRRRMTSLAALSPATMAGAPLSPARRDPSSVSSRKPPLRAFSSGPWQAKQASERIGRMSREKRTGSTAGAAAARCGAAATSSHTASTAVTLGPWRRHDRPAGNGVDRDDSINRPEISMAYRLAGQRAARNGRHPPCPRQEISEGCGCGCGRMSASSDPVYAAHHPSRVPNGSSSRCTIACHSPRDTQRIEAIRQFPLFGGRKVLAMTAETVISENTETTGI